MADGSQVEELNALRENDHLFIFWKVQRYSYNLRAASPVISEDFVCSDTKHIFQYLCIFFMHISESIHRVKYPLITVQTKRKKKKKAIELTLFNIFQSLSLSMSKTAKAAFWNRSFSSSKDFFLSKAKFLHFSTSSMIPEEFWSISLQRIHGEIPKKEKKKISI